MFIVLGITNKVIMNIHVQVLYGHMLFFLLHKHPGIDIE